MKNLLFLAFDGDKLEIGESFLIALISIVIVFAVLFLIIIIIELLQKLIFAKQKPEANKVETSKASTKQVAKKDVTKNTEIKDEDMMVAALIATIDYANETKQDVRLVSIKQIG